MHFETSKFRAVLDNFTKNTYLLIVSLNPKVSKFCHHSFIFYLYFLGPASLNLNIASVKNFFMNNSEELKDILFANDMG